MSQGNTDEVRITGVESSSIRRMEGQQDQYIIPFLLSDSPPNEWMDIFDEDWRNWKAEAEQDFILINLEIVEDILAVTVSFDIMAKRPPFGRFDFSRILTGLNALVDATNATYGTILKQEYERIAALKTMVDKLSF